MVRLKGMAVRFRSERLPQNGTPIVPMNPFVVADGFKSNDPTFTNLRLAPHGDTAVVIRDLFAEVVDVAGKSASCLLSCAAGRRRGVLCEEWCCLSAS
jgi:hypothetical protein